MSVSENKRIYLDKNRFPVTSQDRQKKNKKQINIATWVSVFIEKNNCEEWEIRVREIKNK